MKRKKIAIQKIKWKLFESNLGTQPNNTAFFQTHSSSFVHTMR